MSILYEIPSNVQSLSQPSAEWIGLPPSALLPADSLDDIAIVRERRIQTLKAYLEAGPDYLGETNVQATDTSFLNSANVTLPIRIYTPKNDPPNQTYPVLLWFYGGGFVFGCNLGDDELLRYISHHSHIIVISASYRLAPEHPFPAAIEDAWSAALWIRDNKNLRVDCNQGFYVGGISAGGNLAAVVARRARDRESEGVKIDGQLLGFPWLCSIRDYGFPARLVELEAINECADAPLLSKAGLHMLEVLYGLPNPRNPDFSPLWDERELKGLPKAAVFVAGMDPLRDDGIAYWMALEKEGPGPKIRIFPGMPHAFHRFKDMETAREFKKHMVIGLRELMQSRG